MNSITVEQIKDNIEKAREKITYKPEDSQSAFSLARINVLENMANQLMKDRTSITFKEVGEWLASEGETQFIEPWEYLGTMLFEGVWKFNKADFQINEELSIKRYGESGYQLHGCVVWVFANKQQSELKEKI